MRKPLNKSAEPEPEPEPVPETRTVPVRDNRNAWPPVADEAAEVPVDTADMWDSRLWRSHP